MADDLDKGLKVGVLDIESTNLKADWGYILCACIKEVNKNNLNGPILTYRVDDYTGFAKGGATDEQLVKDLVKGMDSFDIILTWYGSRFDIPFINGRCALQPNPRYPRREFRRDLCFSSRANYALTRHSLENVERFMFGKTEKTRTDFDIWLRGMRGDTKALDYLVDHCEKDVRGTERVYKKMLPLLGKLRRG